MPFVRADWFIATASVPPLYYNILDLPKTDQELETRLEVNVAGNIKNAPGRRVWRAGFNKSGVSRNNRVVERHESQHGAYWKSYDFKGNVDKQNIFRHPLDFIADGGEIIFNLPNGLQAYYLTTASGARLDEAPIDIVFTGERDPIVRNGISCMGCHTEGMKRFTDDVRLVIIKTQTPIYDKAQALRLYAEKQTMDTLIDEDIARYKRALEKSGGVFGGSEPIQQLVKQFEGQLSLEYASAEIGLESEEFLQKILQNSKLQNAGLTALAVPNGSMKRDAWTSQFGAVISTLNIGNYSRPIRSTNNAVRSHRVPNTATPKDVPTPVSKKTTSSFGEPSVRQVYANKDNMVLIPAGEFQMGSSSGVSGAISQHKVYVDSFYMDKYEVTNAQYKKFVDANPEWQKSRINNAYYDSTYLAHWNGNDYPIGKGDYPVVYVSWYAAMAYAGWIGKRLPTEAEWEKAARGRLARKIYPWGNDAPTSHRANYKNNKTVPVGKYPANGYGLHDMAGNVYEWCLDVYISQFQSSSPRRNPILGGKIIDIPLITLVGDNRYRVRRGGSYMSYSRMIGVTSRLGVNPKATTSNCGFRCVIR